MDSTERTRREYVEALEEERRKIRVFERELPLCLQVVTQEIESCKKQIGIEETSSEGPVLEEFIPLRPSSSPSGEEEILHKNGSGIGQERSGKKPDWLRSVQLWNQDPEPLPRGDLPRKPIAVNAKIIGGAFYPFDRDKFGRAPIPAAAAASSTTRTTNGGGEEKEKEGQSQPQSNRKARRCWSQELHRRFLNALDQLGGSHDATPKQIRELMNVDGLTNDEVKSHLQKYRLHNRRPAVQSSSPQAPQFVVVGGIWIPPPEYAAAAAAAAAQPTDTTCAPLHGVFAPVASLPSELGSQQPQDKKMPQNRSPTGPLLSGGGCNQDDHSLADDDRTKSDSPTTSTSSQTTTASPPF